MKLLHQTGDARSATDDRPAAGPAYRVAYSPEGSAFLDGNPQNLYSSLKCVPDTLLPLRVGRTHE